MPRRTRNAPLFSAILCPVDFSTNSRAALRYAATLARQTGCPLFVLHVDDPLLAVATARRFGASALIRADERGLRQFATSTLGAMDAPPITIVTVAGKPSKEIVKAAERHRCDLIVMGYRGIGKASSLLFGSTTEGVVRMTSVPVLAIPPLRRRAKRASTKSRVSYPARTARRNRGSPESK